MMGNHHIELEAKKRFSTKVEDRTGDLCIKILCAIHYATFVSMVFQLEDKVKSFLSEFIETEMPSHLIV